MIFHLPKNFAFSVDQAAKILSCHPDSIRAAIKRKGSGRYHLPARQNTRGGAYVIYAHDLRDFIERTYVGAMVHNDS